MKTKHTDTHKHVYITKLKLIDGGMNIITLKSTETVKNKNKPIAKIITIPLYTTCTVVSPLFGECWMDNKPTNSLMV